MQNLDLKIELWKKRLLDLGKRNRLINFKETKRSNIAITSPSLYDVFKIIVHEEKSLKFSYPLKTMFEENGEEQSISVIKGEIETSQTINEQQRTLKSIRAKAKTSIEEQGINTLYLSLGMIKWKESVNSDITITSPIVLVPVNLKIESINDPYILNLHDDEVVVNPSLTFKFENDFGIKLPEFDEHYDDIREYLSKIVKIAARNNWEVTEDVYLALLSFLKINMYEDLDKNKEKIVSNPIIKSLAGDLSEVIQVPFDLNNYDHDKSRPIETYQVVDADSSQQDAILLSKKGISFVLQGPPGTGKSQTITNIIAEAISDGKRVLFVSEKMAALEVVKKRLTEAKLDDFCLTLHSYKSNKKEVLSQLESTLNMPKIKIQDDILYKLSELEEKRKKLNEYQDELHTKCMPLNTSIYEINGRLAKLDDTEDVVFNIDNIDNIDNTNTEKLNKYKYLINEYANTVGSMRKNGLINPWYGCNILVLTHELRHNIEVTLTRLLPNFKNFLDIYEEIIEFSGANFDYSIDNVKVLMEILNLCIKSPLIPVEWLKSDIDELIGLTNQFTFKYKQYFDLREQLKKKYKLSVFDISSNDVLTIMEKEMKEIKDYIDPVKYNSNKEIVLNADFILAECNEIKKILTSCFDNSEIIYQTLGLKKPDNINYLLYINELVEYIKENPKPTEKWFNEIQLNDVLKILNDAKNHQADLIGIIKKIKGKYNEKIIDIKYEQYIKRFNEEYKNALKIISTFNQIDKLDSINKQIIYDFESNQNPKLFKCKNIIELSIISAEKITALLDIKMANTLEELIVLGMLIGAVNNNPQITAAWFDKNKDSVIDKIINDIKLKQHENKELTEIILSKYSKDILDIDYKEILARFNTEYVNFLKHVKGSYKSDKKVILACSKEMNSKISDNDIISLLVNISTLKENEQWLSENYIIAKELLGDLYIGELTNWESVEKSRESFNIIRNYFGNFQIPDSLKKMLLECKYDEIKEEYSNLNEVKLSDAANTLSEIMNANLENIPIDEVLSSINEVYNKTIELKKDYDFINSFKLSSYCADGVTDIINILNDVKEINMCRKWFNEKDYLLGEYLGNNYIGERTDFEIISNSINAVNKIKSLFENNIPNELIKVLTTCNYPNYDFTLYQESINKLIELHVSDRLDSILKYKKNKINQLDEILKMIDIIINSITLIRDSYEQFTNISRDKLQFETVMSDIISLNKIQKTEQIFIDNEKDFNKKYSFYYNGINTDWFKVIKNLEYAKELNKICHKYSLNEKFTKAVCSDKKMIETAKKYLEDINDSKKILDDDFKWFAEFFENQSELYTMSIYEIHDKIENCLNLALLEDWIDYTAIRKQCIEFGLSDFIEHVEKLEIQEDNILNTFLKRFYKLWLDVTLPKYPAVFSFRSRTQQSIIDDFNQLDKMQLEIARFRIREKLIAKLPDMNVTTSSLDEVGILKRELSKQRKIMPLRRLFKAIPNLLTTLKPCLMMSPLSVSLYLQSDVYNFDLVIFDEASQICTEDAIGAIMRGKQIVIAGDRYQLPPTNFFNTTYSDNDFDVEDEEISEDLDAYDSILDEATNAIPERTLKWHYRSRHENLIAFSNAEIYKHELTTFPSNIDNLPDCGVEYIYVENGIYDRGAKKNNVNEAHRVAELVFEHFDKYPDRSLGVVTFSEAQQQAVENAIRKKRLADTSYEDFFAEDKDEEFFIKNLENVQGDERDTIIFSIGYGKDANGIMYMNFGPLSRNGGYRRLNVAITRAKFNVKLVGSIQPTDINIDKTNSEGVKMLRHYIEYAINGHSCLQNELVLNNKNESDSPFEEAVYEFLTRNGYSVKTQVGCSGYRIDMAVKHPTLSGIFVLGIECDGASYHSARTARERDRLRQSVLEDIGWTIYRVWSTDWIKDTKTEGEKLLKAAEKAISFYETDKVCSLNEKQSSKRK